MTDIRSLDKTKIKQITKNSKTDCLNKKEKKAKKIFTKNHIHFRSSGCQIHLKSMKHLRPTAFGFIIYKDFKTDLEFIFLISIINFKTEDFTPVFLSITMSSTTMKTIPDQLYYCFPWTFNYIHTFINYLLPSKFIQASVSTPKIISLYLIMVSMTTFSSSCFVFIQFRLGKCSSFAFSTNVFLRIKFFVTLNQVIKKCLLK